MANTKERDFSIGLDNHGFRYFDPEAGRYVSRDPIGYGDGMNVYVYVHNNPINAVDPVGLDDALLKAIQNAANEVEAMRPFYEAQDLLPRVVGTKLHKEFQQKLSKIISRKPEWQARVLLEQSIDKQGTTVAKRFIARNKWFWPKGSRRPDVMILKEGVLKHGENASVLMRKGVNLEGKIDNVLDLKTGIDDLQSKWVSDVAERLGVPKDAIQSVRSGADDLVEKIAKVRLKRQMGEELAEGYLKRGAKKVGKIAAKKALVVAFALYAFMEARAEGKEIGSALGEAALSATDLDMVRDMGQYLAESGWQNVEGFANTSDAAKYIGELSGALDERRKATERDRRNGIFMEGEGLDRVLDRLRKGRPYGEVAPWTDSPSISKEEDDTE